MPPLIQECQVSLSPEGVMASLWDQPGAMLLRSALFRAKAERYSFLVARPFSVFSSRGTLSEIESAAGKRQLHGNPWDLLEELMAPFAPMAEHDSQFPLGGCFGYWGYDLQSFVETKAPSWTPNDLNLPDCYVGFYDSLLVFDHHLNKQFIVATGLGPDGLRTDERSIRQAEFWKNTIQNGVEPQSRRSKTDSPVRLSSNLSRESYIRKVEQAQTYIQQGDIYQVNLAQRLHARHGWSSQDIFLNLLEQSPSPFAAYLNCGDFQVVSSSPESFLRLNGDRIRTRPIKGTRPRHADPTRDAQLTYELQTSPKEMAELVMITDLLRNDLGKICEYGSVQVPELVRLERFPQVQHLVSTVEGKLRRNLTHLAALKFSFPGGSISGAPKLRATQIIHQLETVSRGPYTGALGYLGFNRESQLSMIIRTVLCRENDAWFHVGAGIVADSNPEAEYEETLAKAAGICAALVAPSTQEITFEKASTPLPQRSIPT